MKRWEINKVDPTINAMNQFRPFCSILHADDRHQAKAIAEELGGPGEYAVHLWLPPLPPIKLKPARPYIGGRW